MIKRIFPTIRTLNYKKMLKLTVDDRERFVIPFFKETYTDIEIEVKRIQIGDFVISKNDKILFAIERKSWSDLSASIKDGRKENIKKLKILREQTGCKLLYLMEGKARFEEDKRIGRIPYKSLQAHLDHIMIRDDIYVIHSNNEEDSANRLVEFMTNYLTLPYEKIIGGKEIVIEQEPQESNNDMNILTVVVPKTELEIIYNIWSEVPNVTSKTASLFIEAKYHISDLFLGNITKADISTMKYPNGTIIGARSTKIIKVVDNENANNYKYYCNIMAAVPGITKKTAAVILTKVTFNDLIKGTLSLKELADIKKTAKSRIGKSSADKIYKFLVKPAV